MNDSIERMNDSTSTGEFDNSLTNLLNIPKETFTESKEDDSTEDKSEVDEIKDKKPKDDDTSDDPTATPPDLTPNKDESKGDDDDDDDDDDSSTSEVLESLMSEFGEVELEDKEFEDEPEAIKAYINKVLENDRKETGKKAITSLFQAHPEVKQLVEHLSQGYGLDSFLKENRPEEFTPLDLEEATQEQKVNIVRKAYKIKGLSDEEIDDAIEVAKDTNKLDARAENAQNFLKKRHEDSVASIKEKEKQEAEKKAKEIEETNKAVSAVLESGKLAGGAVNLDKDKIQILKDFILGQDKEGNSIRMKTWRELPIDKKLLLDYLVATDFKDLKFGTDTTKSKITKNIKIKNTKANRVDMGSGTKGASNTRSDAPFDLRGFLSSANQ